MTGHNEVVRVVFDPKETNYEKMLAVFWESHDPTQGIRQGNDAGTQYRSGIYVASPEQRRLAEETRDRFHADRTQAVYSRITTEITDTTDVSYAENIHHQKPHTITPANP